jgi:hypothetical protein
VTTAPDPGTNADSETPPVTEDADATTRPRTPDAGADAGADADPDPRPDPDGPIRVRLAAATPVAVGELVGVRVVIDGASDVASVPFHLLYDPRILQFDHGAQGGFLGSDGQQIVFMSAPTQEPGRIVIGLSRLGAVPGIAGSGELCTLFFKGLGTGTTGLTFANASVWSSQSGVVPAEFAPIAVTVR